MKTYIVYVDGNETGTLKAANHNAAERKAFAKYQKKHNIPATETHRVSVTYTEV